MKLTGPGLVRVPSDSHSDWLVCRRARRGRGSVVCCKLRVGGVLGVGGLSSRHVSGLINTRTTVVYIEYY
jgi:hypothetical protein